MSQSNISSVTIALARGPYVAAAIRQAIALAEEHEAELCGLAIIDVPKLFRVGPVPIGAGRHATELRNWRIATARQAAQEILGDFKSQVTTSNIRWSARVEEGVPAAVLTAVQETRNLVALAPDGAFDQGVLEEKLDIARDLVRRGIHPLMILGRVTEEVARIRFIFDGSERCLRTWQWLIDANLWSDASLVIDAPPGLALAKIEQALELARKHRRRAEQAHAVGDPRECVVVGNANCRRWLPPPRRQTPWDDQRVLALG